MVADAKAPRDGKVVDVIATYDPVNKRLIDVMILFKHVYIPSVA